MRKLLALIWNMILDFWILLQFTANYAKDRKMDSLISINYNSKFLSPVRIFSWACPERNIVHIPVYLNLDQIEHILNIWSKVYIQSSTLQPS